MIRYSSQGYVWIAHVKYDGWAGYSKHPYLSKYHSLGYLTINSLASLRLINQV